MKQGRRLYQAYQLTIQLTKGMKKLQSFKFSRVHKQVAYFAVSAELNKKIELHVMDSLKL